jgi:hypothetical protein
MNRGDLAIPEPYVRMPKLCPGFILRWTAMEGVDSDNNRDDEEEDDDIDEISEG